MPSNIGSVIEGVISFDADAGLLAAVRARPSGQGARSQIAGPVPRVPERGDGLSFRSGGGDRAIEPGSLQQRRAR
jgi:hypothetical protein